MPPTNDSASLLTPEVILRAYAAGIFPMAESEDDPSLHWIEPKHRGVFPLDGFHVPRKLAQLIRSDQFEVQVNADFAGVIARCAAPAEGRSTTWINPLIRNLYGALFSQGNCHTVEVYEGGQLVGGLYGVSLGAAFFGESMFHTVRDASKVALCHLVARLIAGGFVLLDAQFITPHLAQFGAQEIPRKEYQRKLGQAIARAADFMVWRQGAAVSGATVMATIAAAQLS